MSIAVIYNPADIDATVTAAMLHKICEYDVTTNVADLSKYRKVISLDNLIHREHVANKIWIVINKSTNSYLKPITKGVMGFFDRLEHIEPTQIISPEIVNGEIVRYGSYLRHYYHLLKLSDWISEEELMRYESLCYSMSTCVRMLDLHDQSILWSLQKNAMSLISKETPDINLSVHSTGNDEYHEFQRFLKDIKKEISEKICTETVLIRKKTFDKSVSKVVGVQTVNAQIWKAPWIFKITSHITSAICIFEYVRNNRIHMRTKYFNDDGEIAINNILSERNLRWTSC